MQTQDGYILKTFRIPSKLGQSGYNNRAVLLWHGILDSADCWVISNITLSIPFNLVDQGYDVVKKV